MLAGTVLLGYVAWQYFGTNVVSRHMQQQLVEDTRRSWAAASSGHGSTTGVDTAAALVRIPRFGSHYVMPVRQGVGAAVLAEGFGQFPDSVDPGQVGNYAIAAHRVTHGEPLRHMPDLRPGDQVIVETAGRTYVYRLDSDPNRLVVSFRDVWVISPLPHNPHGGVQPAQRPGQRLITLTTCSELFHTDNRMIAFGHLVSTRRD
jgi:sortase A